MARKKEFDVPRSVRAETAEGGEVKLVFGHVVPVFGEDEEPGFEEESSVTIPAEAALDLAAALPGAVQESVNVAAHAQA